MSFNVIITDDHPIFRRALAKIIYKAKLVKRVFEANNGLEAIQILEKNLVLIVFLDLVMPIMNGEECIKKINLKYPTTKVIIMSMADDSKTIRNMYDLGCIGYLLKSEEKEEIFRAIEYAKQGKIFYSRRISEILLNDEKKVEKNKAISNAHFSEQELIILKAICAGMSNNEISEIVLRSPRTVERYRQEILNKANVKNPIGLFRYALKNNLIKDE